MILNEKPGAAYQRRESGLGGHAIQFYAKQKLFFKKTLNFISYLFFFMKISNFMLYLVYNSIRNDLLAFYYIIFRFQKHQKCFYLVSRKAKIKIYPPFTNFGGAYKKQLGIISWPHHITRHKSHTEDVNLLLCSGVIANKVIKKYKSININFYSTPCKFSDL